MIYAASQSLLQYPDLKGGVLMDRPPVVPERKVAVTVDGLFLDMIQNSVSPTVMNRAAVANENSALYAEFYKEFQNKAAREQARAEAAAKAAEPTVDAAPTLASNVLQFAARTAVPDGEQAAEPVVTTAPDIAPPVLSQVALAQIQLEQSVSFAHRLRTEKGYSRKAVQRIFASFAKIAALDLVGDAAPELGEQAMSATQNAAQSDISAGLQAEAGQDAALLTPVKPNPLAFLGMSQKYDSHLDMLIVNAPQQGIAPAAQSAFQVNTAEVTQAKPRPSAASAPVMLPVEVQAQVRAIAADSQFDAKLVIQAQALTQGAVDPAQQPLPQQELKVQQLITAAKQQKAAHQGKKIVETLNGVLYAQRYTISVGTAQHGRLMDQDIQGTEVVVGNAPTDAQAGNISLLDKEVDAHAVAKQVVQKREEVIEQTAGHITSAAFQKNGGEVSIRRSIDNYTVKHKVDQKEAPNKMEGSISTVQARFSESAATVLATRPELAKLNLAFAV